MEYRIDLAEDFSPFPFGRYTPQDGEFSGEVFRDKYLKKILMNLVAGDTISVDLNGVKVGIGSSFLTESFGGAVKMGYVDKEIFLKALEIICDDNLYEKEIRQYISDAIVASE